MSSEKTPDLAGLLLSWELSLRAERKSPNTLDVYLSSVRLFLAWCDDQGVPAVLDKKTVNGFISGLLASGRAGGTARTRQLAIRRYAAWLEAEGETDTDALLGLKAPKLDTVVIEPLTDAQLKAMLATCQGQGLSDRRDEAIIRLMFEAGVRAGEVVAMELGDVDLLAGTAVIRRGKGGKGRVVPIGPQAVRAIDRYMRKRRGHRLESSPALWLGDRGRGLSYDGLHKSLGMRASLAGIQGFHPHVLRHTAAHRWLAAGGSEGGLMSVAGWSSPAMLTRYSAARASQRAADEARKLNLGDI